MSRSFLKFDRVTIRLIPILRINMYATWGPPYSILGLYSYQLRSYHLNIMLISLIMLNV